MPNPTDRMMQFFTDDDNGWSDDTSQIMREFNSLAEYLVENLPSNPERTVALRKLLEAKDCAMQAGHYQEPAKQ